MITGPAARRLVGSFACCVLAVVASGCSSSDDAGTTGDASTASAAPSESKAPATPARVVCSGDDEANEDDEGAVQALLQTAQLPPGAWDTAKTPPCPWAISADELLVVPECLAAATAAGAPANTKARNGNGRVTFARAGGVQLDDRIEIYTSRQNVDAIRAILASPAMSDCYTAAVQSRAANESRTKIDDVKVSRFVVQPDAAALGLGFPAVAGFAADPGFASGVNITFTKTTRDSSTPVAMRVITFGSGGLMSTITLIGATPADLDAIDLTDTLRSAAKGFTGIFGPS